MNPQLDFPSAIRSFVGYLEGTHKAAHTIRNYRFDLLDFQAFLNGVYGKSRNLEEISSNDFKLYREQLKERNLKDNTRRRKILTVSRFLIFFAKRKKISHESAKKQPAPLKVEHTPHVVPIVLLLERIVTLPELTLLELRNKAILWTLAETGCLVSEIGRLDVNEEELQVLGKSARVLPISHELKRTLLSLSEKSQGRLFTGFNKYGSLGTALSSRGVELLVKSYSKRLGFELTPRTFRHSLVLEWLRQGVMEEDIRKRLGLKTTYAFRSFDLLLKSSSKTTSIS